MDIKEAIALAKAGQEDGFRFLYEATYQSKYYLALQYMKNEEEAKDVLQDAYIRAFSKLELLQKPEAFSNWFGQIVANTAKNKLVKNNPLLFSEVEAEEGMEDFEYRIEDENSANQPELSYMQQEKNELVHGLIESLSAEQRVCILMFYMEGNSIHQIAATLGCSENTVKSRLNYGRKKLREKAEQLQKKGYKMYGVAPLPLLLYLLRIQEAEVSASGGFADIGIELAKKVFSNPVVQNAMTAPHGGMAYAAQKGLKAGVKATAKSGFLHTAAGKAAAIVVCVCVSGGAVFGVSQFWPGEESRTGTPLQMESSQNEVETSKPETSKPEAAKPENSSKAEQPKMEESSEVSQAPVVPEVRELQDTEYAELIAGQLTKEEVAFVLAYGPEEIPEQGFTPEDYTMLLNSLCMGAGESGMIQSYGPSESWESQYSAEDINRLFASFSDQRFEEGGMHAEFIRVQGDVVTFFPATLNYTATAEITASEYTEGELQIYYTHQVTGYERPSYTLEKKAVLKPDENGLYRIVKIEELA